MSKIIFVLAAVIATGCAESSADVSLSTGGYGGSSPGGADYAASPRVPAPDVTPREVASRHYSHRDELVTCAQCRH